MKFLVKRIKNGEGTFLVIFNLLLFHRGGGERERERGEL